MTWDYLNGIISGIICEFSKTGIFNLHKILVMKKWSLGLLFAFTTVVALAQEKNEKTLLWQVSGNGLAKPSYLFGTIHMICSEDAMLSDSLINIIKNSDQVYFEVDMDNLFEMLGVMKKMKMRDDTTLADLLTKEEYQKVKSYFEAKETLLPFDVVETYKPMLAASLLMEPASTCKKSEAMEEVIMKEAKAYRKKIKGLETMAYQLSIFDTIPYKMQALELVKYVDAVKTGKDDESKEYDKLLNAYKDQDLSKLEQITKSSDIGISSFTDILLYNRNRNWVEKLKDIMIDHSVLVAVGAGHLPGDKGLINLLRKAGYTVSPITNKIKRSNEI
jgi:uncharacterized protein